MLNVHLELLRESCHHEGRALLITNSAQRKAVLREEKRDLVLMISLESLDPAVPEDLPLTIQAHKPI